MKTRPTGWAQQLRFIRTPLALVALAAAFVLTAAPPPVAANTISVTASGKDTTINYLGQTRWGGQTYARIGRINDNDTTYSYVMPFALPDLQGETIQSATVTINFNGGSWGAANLGDVDLFGSLLSSTDGAVNNGNLSVDASNPTNPDAILLQDNFVDTSDLVAGGYGWKTTGDVSNFLTAMYDSGVQPGEYVYMMLSLDKFPPSDYRYLVVDTANSSNKPQLDINLAPPIVNLEINPNYYDTVVNTNGSTKFAGDANGRIGKISDNGFNYNYVAPFALPDLRGGTLDSATFSLNVSGGSYNAAGSLGNLDLYGSLLNRAFAQVNESVFYVDGENPSNPDAMLLQDDFIPSADLLANGYGYRTSADLTSFINAQYAAGAQPGSYIYLITTLDQIPGGDYKYFNVKTTDSSTKPSLNVQISGMNEDGTEWGTTDKITSNGITWTFDTDVTYGTFATGDFWVVGPANIVSIENHLNAPGYNVSAGQNGSMINPLDGHAASLQGYDDGSSDYDPTLNAALPNGQPVSATNPLALAVGDSLVSAVSWVYNSSSDREPGCPVFKSGRPRPQLRSAAVLSVLGSVPPDNSFRPPYAGTSKPLYNVADLDTTKLANLTPPTSGVPDVTTLEAKMSRPWIDHRSSYVGRYMHPSMNMPDYGRDMGYVVNDTALMLQLDFSQLPGSPTKDKLLINLVQYGIDTTAVADSGGGWQADGGHMLGRKMPVLFAGLLLDNQHMKDVGTWGKATSSSSGGLVAFQEYQTHFEVTQTEIDLLQTGLTPNPSGSGGWPSDHPSVKPGGQWSPDYRNVWNEATQTVIWQHIAYDSDYMGYPEWGIRHSYWPERDNGHKAAYYRGINGSVTSGIGLVVQIMGATSLWGNDAFLDYQDRYMLWTNNGTDMTNTPTVLTRNMWSLYRNNYGTPWTGDPDPSD